MMDGWIDGWMGDYLDDGWWMDDYLDGWMNGWMDGWLDGLFDGWMDGWLSEWMDGWMDFEVNADSFVTDAVFRRKSSQRDQNTHKHTLCGVPVNPKFWPAGDWSAKALNLLSDKSVSQSSCWFIHKDESRERHLQTLWFILSLFLC